MLNLKRQVILFIVLLQAAQLSATTRKVFFIGNSYTYTNSMPDMLRSFATAKGDTLIHSMSAPGGHKFVQHTTNATTLAGIFSQQWDVVVLQEQSQLPSFPPAQVATDVYPYAEWLDSVVHENRACTQTMFMMTWGRRGGDAMNCPGYPVVCTYAGMQGRLRDSYMQMTQDNNAIVAPVGSAWKVVVDSFPAIDLYQPDESHPSIAGSYLQACVFYASIFHRPSKGCTYLGGLPAATAQILQRIADKVVLDSLSQWEQYGNYPYGVQSHTHLTGGAVAFSSQRQKANSYSWSFGDGDTDTAANPAHTYSAAGIYPVLFTVTNDCFSFTLKDTVHIGVTVGVNSVVSIGSSIDVLQGAAGKVTFALKAAAYDVLEIYNTTGSLVKRYDIHQEVLSGEFVPGMYIYRVYSADRRRLLTGKFVAYK